jgi:hypothetical protein
VAKRAAKKLRTSGKPESNQKALFATKTLDGGVEESDDLVLVADESEGSDGAVAYRSVFAVDPEASFCKLLHGQEHDSFEGVPSSSAKLVSEI